MQVYANKMLLRSRYVGAALALFNKKLCDLNPYELNAVIAGVVKDKIVDTKFDEAEKLYSSKRIAIYFSIEFLLGRAALDALNNVGLLKDTRDIFAEEGIDIYCLEEVDDPALGNGGLGRLAACFAESAATLGYPMFGVGLYYKYGLFRQKFDENGRQVEIPDDWTAHGEPWFEARPDEAVVVEFRDTKVKAVPYVMPIVGYNSDKHEYASNAFPLTLWKAEAIPGVTNEHASKISDILYPSESTDDGKKLRIRQEYFFVSAMMQKIFKTHLAKHGTLDNIEDYYIFQMNDTHPVFGCLEFIRLLKQHGYSFEEASKKAKKCFAYTNHTIMSEALEKWQVNLFNDVLSGIFKVVEELNQELIDELLKKPEFYFDKEKKQPKWGDIRKYEFVDEGCVHMARIACYVGCKINGVAAVHTEIIKEQTLAKWYKLYPDKFVNETNGVTPRRWVLLSNPDLTAFLNKYVGEGWAVRMDMLEKLELYKNDPKVLAEFASVKEKAKGNLVKYIKACEGVLIDKESMIAVQVKRFHEYKRQLMMALCILSIYDQLKEGKLPDFYKTTFIIGGKAAASYEKAKRIMMLLKDIQDMVNNDPDVSGKLKVVVLTNFRVSYGEKVYAGADLSEQISVAGTEASGTGNMKFMMNGAPTIGTLDGANIEIVEEAGSKNNYIFGATVDELKRIKPIYNHKMFLDANPDLVALLSYLKGEKNLKRTYWDLVDTLLYDDRYFVMYDLRSYIETTLKTNSDYAAEKQTGDMSCWTRKGLKNTAHSGKFSSDRTIEGYAKEIWHIEKV